MKNLLITICLGSIILLSSCGGDDGEEIEVGVNGSVTYNESTVTLNAGIFGETSQDGAYGAFYFLSDGEMSYDAETEEVSYQGTFLVGVTIASNSDGFQSGTYNVDLTGNRIAIVVIVDEENQLGDIATGGTVNIQGSAQTNTMTFNLEFENDVRLTGNATGTYQQVDIE